MVKTARGKRDSAQPDKVASLDSTLSKGLQILETLAQSEQGRGVSELSRELKLTKSNVFRLLQTLKTLGYVKLSPDKLYSATLKTWQVGRVVVDNLNLRDIARAEMASLSENTRETIYLAVPEHLSVVYLDKIDSQQPIRSWNAVGGTAPIHCVGTGKAILSANYLTMRSIVSGNLKAYTSRSITRLKQLDDEMALIAERGYAIDTGEFRERILSFGAAVRLPTGEAIAALGISVPDVNLPENGQQLFGELVKEAAQRVSSRL